MEDFPTDLMESMFSGSGMVEDNLTLTLTCAEASLQAANGTTLLPVDIAIGARAFQVLYSCLQVVFGIPLNALILILIFKFKKLRTTSFGIAVQIAMADMVFTMIYGLPTVVNHAAGRWMLSSEYCVLSGLVLFILSSLRTLLIFAFSFDRFASVFAPFSYPKQSCKITIFLCGIAWSISLSTSLTAIPQGLDCYIFSEPILYCTFSSRCSTTCSIFQKIFLVAIVVPATCVPTVFFIALYFKGRKIRRKESQMFGLSSKTIPDHEWRAFNTFFLLLLAVFLVTFPPLLFISTIAKYFGTVTQTLTTQLASNIVNLLVITDPIIILRNADFKEAFNKLMKQFLDTLRKCR